MTEEHELRVPFKEVSRVVIACKCGAEITLDLTQKAHLEIDWKTKNLECPICRNKFDSNLKAALNDLSGWYFNAEKSEEQVFFRIRKSAMS